MDAVTPPQPPAGRPHPVAGPGGLPALALDARDGARAQVCLHGAHVTSWRPAGDADDRLFLSARSRFAAGAAIRGGVPISFPQFADQGPLRAHGFARISDWRVVGDEGEGEGALPGRAHLRLEASPVTRAAWPHRFRLDLSIGIAGRSLALELAVENTGDAPFAFTGALHTYLRVRDIGQVAIRGLTGARYRDKVKGADDVLESASAITIAGETDRVYYAAPERILVEEPGRRLALRATGFPDTVVWNPGPIRAAAMDDMEPDGQRRMLCVEAAASRAPIGVEPGQVWFGTQTLVAE